MFRLMTVGLIIALNAASVAQAQSREPMLWTIFNRFFRIDEARSRERGGAGLGLAIAKWAVEIHGGRITVHEARDGGSEFRISLPLAESSSTRQQRGT